MTKELIGWLLIVVGWIIVHVLSTHRELNKTKLDLSLKLLQKIFDLEAQVMKYHISESRNEAEELRIMTSFSEVSADISFADCDSEAVSDAYIAFKKMAILQNFRTSAFSRQNPNCDFLLNIAAAGLDLRSTLKHQISEKLLSPNGFSYIRFGSTKGSF